MLFRIYGLLSLMVFALAIVPFWQDPENPRARFSQWLFLALAMVFSPIVLPNMLLQRFRKKRDFEAKGLEDPLPPGKGGKHCSLSKLWI